MKRLRIIHPLLTVAFPIFFVYYYNIGQLSLEELWLPLAIALFSALFLWGVLALFLRHAEKSALLVSLAGVLFFSYGHVYNFLMLFWEGDLRWQRHAVLAPLWALLLFRGSMLIVQTHRPLGRLTSYMNVTTCLLVILFLAQIVPYEFRREVLNHGQVAQHRQVTLPKSLHRADLPDVYYIILDSYARQDTLQSIYHYDNSAFIAHLRAKGFYVADHSSANYCQTQLSLASSLNFTYLDRVAEQTGINSDNRQPLRELFLDNNVFDIFRAMGYRLVVYPSGFAGTLFKGDVKVMSDDRTSNFQHCLLSTTMMRIFVMANPRGILDQGERHRRRVRGTLEHLPDAARMRGPVFVFAHIVCPHPPFVFGPHGEAVHFQYSSTMFSDNNTQGQSASKEEYIEGYRNQVIFLTGKIQDTIDRILAQSRRPPIIILQADHGPHAMGLLDVEGRSPFDFPERLGILNAYYLPGGGEKGLYDSISPVNTFPLILNRYFGGSYKLQKDESYISTWGAPYLFTRATQVVQRGGSAH